MSYACHASSWACVSVQASCEDGGPSHGLQANHCRAADQTQKRSSLTKPKTIQPPPVPTKSDLAETGTIIADRWKNHKTSPNLYGFRKVSSFPMNFLQSARTRRFLQLSIIRLHRNGESHQCLFSSRPRYCCILPTKLSYLHLPQAICGRERN